MMDQRKTNGEYEKTRVDCCTALGVAGRGAITTTAAGCRRPDKHIATPQYRCYLPRRNSRDVLQCTHQPEPSRLWINRGIRRRVRIGRRCRQHHAVHPSLFGIPAAPVAAAGATGPITPVVVIGPPVELAPNAPVRPVAPAAVRPTPDEPG